MIPAARPSIPSIKLTEFIQPKTAMITTGIAKIPNSNPPKVAIAPVNPKSRPMTI